LYLHAAHHDQTTPGDQREKQAGRGEKGKIVVWDLDF
jgi:hypothetical protein